MQLLDPLQVDRRHHAHQEVGVARDIDLLGDHRPVQALVEQQIRVRAYLFPRRERARLLSERRRLGLIVQVLAAAPAAGLAVTRKQRFEFCEQVGVDAKMAEVIVAALRRLGHRRFHGSAVEAVESVALDDRGVEFLAPENMLEGARHRGGARAR